MRFSCIGLFFLIPKNYSAIGRETAFLIEGYRKGEYPSEPNSLSRNYEIAELHRWWDNQLEGQ